MSVEPQKSFEIMSVPNNEVTLSYHEDMSDTIEDKDEMSVPNNEVTLSCHEDMAKRS
jgi:hypothetical protein